MLFESPVNGTYDGQTADNGQTCGISTPFHTLFSLLDNEICWSSCNVVYGRVVFTKVIRLVLLARTPVDKEVSLLDSVADPVEAHVNGFGSALFHGVES